MSESNNPQRNDTIRYDTMRRYLVMFGLATSNKRPLHLFLSRSFFFFPCDTLQVFRSGTLRAGTEKDMACKCKANANANQNNTDTLHSSCTRANKSRFMSIMLEQMSKLPMSRSGLGKPLCTPTPYPVQKRRPVADVHTKYHQKKEKTKRHNNNQQTRHNQDTNKHVQRNGIVTLLTAPKNVKHSITQF